AQTASIPLSTTPSAPPAQGGTLSNGVAWTVNAGSWAGLRGYYNIDPAQGPQVYSFSQPAWLRYGLRGLDEDGECITVPAGSVPEAIAPNLGWTPAPGGGGSLCDAVGTVSNAVLFDSVFVPPGPVTSLSLDLAGAADPLRFPRGPSFIEVSPFASQPPLATCTADQTRATERFWFFGTNAGIDFSTTGTIATALFAPGTSSIEGTTV